MAKYEDYVKGTIDDEINDASTNSATRQNEAQETGFEIPEQFKGKSAEEIAKAYAELQKLNSRQAQDLGKMRKTVDDYVALQSQASRPPEDEDTPSTPVTVDDLYEDAEGAISKVVEKAANSRIEALEKQLKEQEVEAHLAELNTKYPGWRDTAQTSEFMEWVGENAYRQRLATAADQYDFDAADALLGMYNDLKGRTTTEDNSAEREQQLRDATLETSSPGTPEHVEEFSRTDLMNARIAAKQGNQKARTWLQVHSDAIARAYEEGHITD